MRTGAALILLVLTAAPARSQTRCDLLVLPILGVPPPEMSLPAPGRIAQSLASRLPKDLVVLAEESAGRVVPEDIERLVRARAAELKASVVIWGELRLPKGCPAPRSVRLRILDVKTGVILGLDLCPIKPLKKQFVAATVKVFKSDMIPGLRLPATKIRPKKPSLDIPCPEPKPCPPCECPQVAEIKEAEKPRMFMAAGLWLTSHPRWSSSGLGATVELSYSPQDWLEVGLGTQASWSRQIEQEQLEATYTAWPINVWSRLRLGNGSLEGLFDLGLQAAITRLEEAVGNARERVKPSVIIRLGMRYLPADGLGFQLTAGSTVYLAGQTYSELVMPWYSFELGLSVVVPIL